MLNHFTQPTRIGARKPAWPIRPGTGFGFLVLAVALSGCDVLSYDVTATLEKPAAVQQPVTKAVGPTLEGEELTNLSCAGDFEPEGPQPLPSNYTVEPASPQPIVLPTKEVSVGNAPGAAAKTP